MAERFKERVNIQPIDTRTGGAQGVMSLVQKLEAFKGMAQAQAVKVGTERATKRGAEAAGQVELQRDEKGVTKAPKFKEKKFIGSIERQAYNKTLRNAYLSSLDNDNRGAISKIASENPDDILNFNDQVEAYRKGVLSGVDPSVREIVQIDLDRKISSLRVRIQDADIKKQVKKSKNIANESIISAVNLASIEARNGDSVGDTLASDEIIKAFTVLDSGVESGFWDASSARQKKREIERDVTSQKFLGEIDRRADQSIDGANEYLADLEKRVRKGFTPDEWRNVIVEGQQNVNRKASRLKRQSVAVKKEIDMEESVNRGMEFLSPDVPADPAKTSQDRKDVNNAFNNISKEWAGMEPKEMLDSITGFVKNTGIMPDVLISNINAAMRSGNKDQVLVFSELVETIAENPRSSVILKDLPTEARAISKQVFDSINAGIDAETAVEIASKNVYGLTDAEKENIKLKARVVAPDLPIFLEDMLDRDFDPSILPFFGEEPDVSPEFQADFNVNFNRFMVHTNGNEKQSQELAYESVKKLWGATSIGGPNRMMKYSPEVFYSVQGIGNKWMRSQYKSDLKGIGIDHGDTAIAVDPESLDSGTPEWVVMLEGKDGKINPLMVDGEKVLWAPDFTKTREYHKMRAKPKEETLKAKTLKKELNELVFPLTPESLSRADSKKVN